MFSEVKSTYTDHVVCHNFTDKCRRKLKFSLRISSRYGALTFHCLVEILAANFWTATYIKSSNIWTATYKVGIHLKVSKVKPSILLVLTSGG